MVGWEQWLQGIVAIFIIVTPPDPVKVLLFNDLVDRAGQNRQTAALRVSFYVLVILGVTAVIGRQLLEVLGIDLNAFRVVGGLIITTMGFEMLYGGAPSRAQGQSEYKSEQSEGAGEDDGLLMPLSTPLLAGPGAIATVITVSSFNDTITPMFVALAGVGAVVVGVYVSMAFLGGLLAKLSERATQLLARLGGVLLATLGTQMILGGLKMFFE